MPCDQPVATAIAAGCSPVVRRLTRRASAGLIALLLAACGDGGSEQASGERPVGSAEATSEEAAQDIPAAGTDQTLLALVNAARASGQRCGEAVWPPAEPLQLHAAAKQAATVQADWIRRSGVFSHTGEGGSTPGQRLSATGYAWAAVGENLATGFGRLDAVVSAWLASPGHCENLMNPTFVEVGFAHLDATSGQVSVTAQVLARPR